VRKFEQGLLKFLRDKHPEVTKEIRDTGKMEDAVKAKLDSAIQEFTVKFQG
jgi:F0F1-type ATP synthase alpha subunit